MVALLAGCLSGFSQGFTNSYLVPGQQYYKVLVAGTGIYRLQASVLQQAGINVAGIRPEQYQLFYRGKEQAISIGLQSSGALDYIDFYGKKNDGALETVLYPKAEWQTNPNVSLFTDTASYFLTYTNTPLVTGLRMAVFRGDQNGSYPVISAAQSVAQTNKTDVYYVGRGYYEADQNKIFHTYFDAGEGLSGPELPIGYPVVYKATCGPDVVKSQTITAEIRAIGVNGRTHSCAAAFSPDGSAGSFTNAGSFSFEGFTATSGLFTIPPGSVAPDGSVYIQLTAPANTDGSNNRISICGYKLSYTRNMNLRNNGAASESYYLPAQPQDNATLNIANVTAQTALFDVSDPDRPRIVQPFLQVAGTWSGSVNGLLSGGSFLASAAPVYINGAQIKKANIRSFNTQKADYLIVTTKDLMQPGGNYTNPVKAYAEYRASAAGGSYDTLVADMDALADCFGYGVYNAQAIRNFAAYMLQGKPKMLLLAGKGVSILYRKSRFFQQRNRVPAWGDPGSDVAITAGLGSSVFEPAIPTGRINARFPAELAAYLDKVKQHEALPYTDLWRKKTVSVSGGLSASELEELRGYSQAFNAQAVKPYLGAKTVYYYKSTNDIIHTIDINADVNTGCSMINVFGHSYLFGSDVDIGSPSDGKVNNAGKYPMIILNGCYAGNLFSDSTQNNTVTLSDDWVLAKGLGAVAFLGNVDEGFPEIMSRYITQFYSVLFNDSAYFGKPLGVVQQEAIRRFMHNNGNASGTLDSILAAQFELHSDPAVKLFSPEKPDYTISSNDISFAERNVTASTAQFNLRFVMSNPAKAPADSFLVTLRRTLPDGSFTTTGYKYKAPLYSDTLLFPVSRAPLSAGLNRFELTLDALDSIPELNEGNNSAVFEYNLPYSGVNPLYPPEYGIVGSRSVRLLSESSNPAEKNRKYKLQLDTSASFTSQVLKDTAATANSLLTWNTTLPDLPDSTVYYWRVKFDDDTAWRSTSFTYIKGISEGWSQSRYPQYHEVKPVNIGINAAGNTFSFPPSQLSLSVTAAGIFADGLSDIQLNGVSITNGSALPCGPNNVINSLLMVRLDRESLIPNPFVNGDPDKYFKYLCGRQPLVVNFFRERVDSNAFNSNIAQINNFIDSTQTGDYILIVNDYYLRYKGLDTVLRAGLPKIGADPAKIKLLHNGDPLLIFGKKGAAPGSAVQPMPDPNSPLPSYKQKLNYSVVLNAQPDSGVLECPRIGPASAWKQVISRFKYPDANLQKATVEVHAITLEGRDSVYVSARPDSVIDISGINAKQFPYIYLRSFVKDKHNFPPVPPQLKRWMVLYQGVPEGLIDESLVGTPSLPDMQEGQSATLKLGFRNITGRAFPDSLTVQYSLANSGKATKNAAFKIRKLNAFDTAVFTIPLSSLGQAGSNRLNINVNPRIFPELTYSNNSAEFQFNVTPDKTNPLLDVSFDGVHIMDGDIVAPKPGISVLLKDENQYLKVTDASHFTLSIKPVSCASCSTLTIDTKNDPSVTFSTDGKTNTARLSYTPKTPFQDGKYQLTVQGTDAGGNKAGHDYSVNFEVVNQASVTNFYPWPNPFSTGTRFVFTLTGADVPEDIKIQVLTVSGKVVREIMRSELGPLRIGNNISAYTYDGTDEYGDKLANGVYLYRVLVRHNGQVLDHRNTAADDTFKHGFGKMYIMR